MSAQYNTVSQSATVSGGGLGRRTGLSTGKKVAIGVVLVVVVAAIVGVTVYFTVYHNKEVVKMFYYRHTCSRPEKYMSINL